MGTLRDQESETLGANVSPELKRKVRIAAAKQNKSISEWLRDVVDREASDV